VQDFRKREVANWWNFSLIVFVLAFRASVSISQLDYWYFLWGLIGLGAGFVLAELFYYSRLFAGGDAKLLMALGTILPLSFYWKDNVNILLIFLLMFLFAGAVYGFVYSLLLSAFNFGKFKKEFVNQFLKYKNINYITIIVGTVLSILLIIFELYFFILLPILLIISPILFNYAKSIEEVCMNRLVAVKDLTIGDWTVKSIKIRNKLIKPHWEGLSEEELNLVQRRLDKNKKVWVKQGIPFTPSFLFGLLITIIFLYSFTNVL